MSDQRVGERMTDLVVVVPSRRRPDAAFALAAAFAETGATARLVFALDADDPTEPSYARAHDAYPATTVHVAPAPNPPTMVDALNRVADLYAGEAYAIGFMGDDNRPRTSGWDHRYVDALRQLGTGIVYGDDLLQHERLPTQAALTADIVRVLGHMAPPQLKHLFVDNYWKALGEAAGCLRYLPDVVVEHLHPLAGKAEWDAGYRRANSPAKYQADMAALDRYLAENLTAEAGKVRALR